MKKVTGSYYSLLSYTSMVCAFTALLIISKAAAGPIR
jgi:hypothetical protein